MYTKQILNDVASISRQRQAIADKIEEIKSVQKDINLLDGKLSRTYAEANGKVFQVEMDSLVNPSTDLHATTFYRLSIFRLGNFPES